MKKRNTENGKYYCISNPIGKNLKTGNFCVGIKFYMAQNKDFLFEWVDPETGEEYKKVLSKEYVKNHCFPAYRWLWNDVELKKEFKGMFYLISYNDIYTY